MVSKIEGKRIILRTLTKADVPDLYRYCRDRKILRHTGIPHNPYKREHAERFVKQTHREHRRKTAYHRGIADRTTGRIIGMISLFKISAQHKSAEIGYWLGREFWGQGIMAEALQLYLRFAFRELRLNRVSALVFPGNRRSSNLLERAGFSCEGRLRKSSKVRNRWTDELIYAILNSDYKGRHRQHT